MWCPLFTQSFVKLDSLVQIWHEHAGAHTHAYTHTHTHTHTHIYIYVHSYTRIYTYIHTCMHAYRHTYKKVKVKCFRYTPGVAQRVGRGIALFFHDRGTRTGWVVSSTPRPHFIPGKDQVPIVQEAGWAPGTVWKGGKSRPHRDSIPDHPARSQSLYRLNYPAHTHIYTYIHTYKHVNIHTQIYTCASIHTLIYIYVYTHTHIYIHIRMHAYVHIYLYMHT